MRKVGYCFACVAAGVIFFGASACSSGTGMSGAELFAQYCASCHPKGGNTITPHKTLHKKDLQANNIRTAGDIVSRMRNPRGPGMPRFERNVITDKDAAKIGRYILSEFD